MVEDDKDPFNNKVTESKEDFHTIADNFPNLAWMAKADGYIYWYNKLWYEYTNTTLEEMLGWGWQKVHHPDHIEGVTERFKKAVEKDCLWEDTFPLKGSDGKYRWFLSRAAPIKNIDGVTVKWFGTNTDITERIDLEQTSKKNELRFQGAVQAIEGTLWTNNAIGEMVGEQPGWEQLTGQTHDQYQNYGWANSVHPDDSQPTIDAWEDAIKHSKPFIFEHRVKVKSGEYRHFSIRAIPLLNSDHTIMEWVGIHTDITERKTYELTLIESEQRFRNMAEASNVLIAVADETGSTTYVNKAWTNFTGTKMEDMLKFGWTDLLEPSNVDAYINSYQNAFAKKEPFISEYQLKNGKGEHRWLITNAQPRFLQNGTFEGYIGSSIDITERKVAEQRLKDSEENLRNIIKKAPVAMCLLMGDNYVVEMANEKMFEFWGTTSDVMHKPIFEELPDAKNQGLEELLNSVYKTGLSYSAQNLPIKLLKNGKLEIVYVNFLYEPFLDNNNSVSGVLAVALDVTQEVKARSLIENEYFRFKTLSDAMPQFVWTATPDGNLDFLNKQWFDYSGYSHEQSVGAGWGTSIYNEDLPALAENWTYSLQTGEPYQVEARICRYDGMYRWHLIRAVAIKENDNIVQWVGTTTDINDQKRYEFELNQLSSELAALNEELVASNEEISDTNNQLSLINSDLDNFIYTASHDLKAPIANIEGLMNALIEDLPETVRTDGSVEMMTGLINSSIERFKKTINQLTDITKLQKEYNFEANDVPINLILKNVLLDLQQMINQSKAQIKIDENTHTTVLFSEKNLQSLLYNLISNGIKYRSPERNPNISISCIDVPGYKILSVSDNGLGIDPRQQSKLFSMFVRLHDHVEGSGVGLYIVKKMVENAGGKIEVESILGVGSTFNVYFKNKK